MSYYSGMPRVLRDKNRELLIFQLASWHFRKYTYINKTKVKWNPGSLLYTLAKLWIWQKQRWEREMGGFLICLNVRISEHLLKLLYCLCKNNANTEKTICCYVNCVYNMFCCCKQIICSQLTINKIISPVRLLKGYANSLWMAER